jgi:hypothetical protein
MLQRAVFALLNVGSVALLERSECCSCAQFFTKPWRQDHMKSHMLTQHSARFKDYSALPVLQKESFFDVAGGIGSQPRSKSREVLQQARC